MIQAPCQHLKDREVGYVSGLVFYLLDMERKDAWFADVKRLLEAGDTVELRPGGYSMWPAIRPGKDTVYIRAADAYRPSDIVLASCGTSGAVVLHRIVRVIPDGVVLRGDSNLYQTETCPFGAIAGRVEAHVRDVRDVTRSLSLRLPAALQRLPDGLRRPLVRILNLWKDGI